MSRRKLWQLFAIAMMLAVQACREAPRTPKQHPTAQDGYRQPERLIAALGIHPGDTVADIGAGGGYLTPHLARAVGPDGHVVATEIDASALAALRERSRNLRQVEARLVSADASGLEAAHFDLVLLAQVDHLLTDPAAYLRQLKPALRPGGRVVITNREDRLAAAQAAAKAAGFHVEVVAAGLPAQFLLRLQGE